MNNCHLPEIKILILSDIHYEIASAADPKPSVANTGTNINPMEKLHDFIHDECINADLIICPGDITSFADQVAFGKGWKELNTLKENVGASKLIAATGNHEIISRVENANGTCGNVNDEVDPLKILYGLDDYPTKFNDISQKWIYWGKGFEIIYGETWKVVIINSCHFHGSLRRNEYERGRISDVAICELKCELEDKEKDRAIRILVIHHPPASQEGDGGELGRIPMSNGEALINALANTNDDWLVIHGHKHFQRLIRAQGGGNPPILFGAGSFGANLTGVISTKTKNQFYLLKIKCVEDSLGMERMEGVIDSYFWNCEKWQTVEEAKHGLPNGCGFSFVTKDTAHLTSQLIAHVKSLGTYAKWNELKNEFSELNYLLPESIRNIKKALKKHNVAVLPDVDDECHPQQISFKETKDEE